MIIPASTTARGMTASLTACGLSVPTEAAKWLNLAANLQSTEIAKEDLQATLDGLTAKTTAATIERIATERVLAAERKMVADELAEVAAARAVTVIRSQRDQLISKARPGFDTLAATLLSLADTYAPGEPSLTVLERGPEAAAAWSAIRQVSDQLDGYARLWAELHGTTATADTFAATYDGDHWKRVDAQAAYDSGERWHALAVTGTPLRFNTYAEGLSLADATPVKELRAVPNPDGFVGYAQAR